MALLLFITLSPHQFSLPSTASLSLLLSNLQLPLVQMFAINSGNRYLTREEYK